MTAFFSFFGATTVDSQRVLVVAAVLALLTVTLAVLLCLPVRDERPDLVAGGKLPPAQSVAAYRSTARQAAASQPEWLLWDSTEEQDLTPAERVLLRNGIVRIGGPRG